MRAQMILYCCVIAIRLCASDSSVSHDDSRENQVRRSQWSSQQRSQSEHYASTHGENSAAGKTCVLDKYNCNSLSVQDRAGLEAITQLHRQLDDDTTAVGDTCVLDEYNCNTLSQQDRAGLEAITQLHRQLDDDANGNVDLSESDDFLREELQYDSGYEKRQKAFHHNDDMHISVRELWDAWLRSEVHNWTTEQTVEWLAQSVDLPQYKTVFLQHKVTGATLPRLAVNNMQYLSNVLGIKDPIHKQKLALKAMDVVLFGPPKGSRWKDWLLASLILGATLGGWAALRAGRASRSQVQRMLRDMEQLRRAEMALDDLQKELEKAKLEQENVNTEKQNLEKKLREAGDAPSLVSASSDLEVTQLKAEIEMLRAELRRAEGELEDRCWAPPSGLQQWLQLTHEVENRSYQRKKQAAEAQLQHARDACEKLRKKRSSLVGAFVSTHGKSIDDVDRSIVEARTALNEVTQELQERVHRWKQIEMLCGFNIVNNNGLQYLESALYRMPNGRSNNRGPRVSSSTDDLSVGDDAASISAVPESISAWREDSSGSEDQEAPHYPLDLRLAEARHQLEERLASEAREHRRDEMQRARPTNIIDERRGGREPVQFLVGGDNLSWCGNEDQSRYASSPHLRTAPPPSTLSPHTSIFITPASSLVSPASSLVSSASSLISPATSPLPSATSPVSPATSPVSTSSTQGLLARTGASSGHIVGPSGAPRAPPRRPHSLSNFGNMVRSRSSDVMVPSPADEPRVPSRTPFVRQRTVAEETVTQAPTEITNNTPTPPNEESTDSSLIEDDNSSSSSKTRRRKLHFPFTKKSKVHA